MKQETEAVAVAVADTDVGSGIAALSESSGAFDVRGSFASEFDRSSSAIVQYHKYRAAYNDAAEAARQQFHHEEVRLSEVRVEYLATKWIAEHCRKQVRAEFREFRRIGQKKDAAWSAQRLQQLIDGKRRQLSRRKDAKMQGIFDQRAIDSATKQQDDFNEHSRTRAEKWQSRLSEDDEVERRERRQQYEGATEQSAAPLSDVS